MDWSFAIKVLYGEQYQGKCDVYSGKWASKYRRNSPATSIAVYPYYSWITSTKCPSFTITTLKDIFTNLTTLLSQASDLRVLRNQTNTAVSTCQQKRTDQRAHIFAQSLMSHRACCHTCYTIQLMHYSHFKTQQLQHLKSIIC